MTARPASSSGRGGGWLADRFRLLGPLVLVLLAAAVMFSSPSAHADEVDGLEGGAASLGAELPAAAPCVSRSFAYGTDASVAQPGNQEGERTEAAHRPAAPASTTVYDTPTNLARTSTSQSLRSVAPQATPTSTGDCDGDAWVIGEFWEGRTRWAARAFQARAWDGPPRGSSHLETCASNEAWLRGVIVRGERVIDIGIDTSRQGNRSPYYELERRVIAETDYPVEERWWFPSAGPYPGVRVGACS